MGLFNTIKDFKCECPNCGKVLTDFQTKDGECCLLEVEATSVDNFYTECTCGVWVEYLATPIKYTRFIMTATYENGDQIDKIVNID